jgi:hypothetical protein
MTRLAVGCWSGEVYPPLSNGNVVLVRQGRFWCTPIEDEVRWSRDGIHWADREHTQKSVTLPSPSFRRFGVCSDLE